MPLLKEDTGTPRASVFDKQGEGAFLNETGPESGYGDRLSTGTSFTGSTKANESLASGAFNETVQRDTLVHTSVPHRGQTMDSALHWGQGLTGRSVVLLVFCVDARSDEVSDVTQRGVGVHHKALALWPPSLPPQWPDSTSSLVR
ncbi:unnamed protein product [Arctogadus glacialis]